MLKIKKPARTKTASEMNKARLISRFVYFFKIIATISVPPEDAPTLNVIAEPIAIQPIAKISSRRGSPVKVFAEPKSATPSASSSRGNIFSKTNVESDIKSEQ